jgi:O-antigen ligase
MAYTPPPRDVPEWQPLANAMGAGTARNPPGSALPLLYKAAVLLYVCAVVLFSYREGMTLYAKGAAIVVAGLFAFRYFVGTDRLQFPLEYRLLGVWFLIGVIASALSPELDYSLPRILTLAQLFPIAFMLSNFVFSNGDGRFYWAIVVAAGALSGVVTLVDPMRFSTIDGRVYGTLGNANTYAVMLVSCVAVSLAGMVGVRGLLRKAICVGAGVFFLYLVLRTGSRMGMLASLIAVAVAVWAYQGTGSPQSRGVTRRLYWLVIAAVLLGGAVYFVTSSEFNDRLENLFSALDKGDFGSVGDNSLKSRALLYVKAFDLFLESPLIGVGLDVFATAGIDYRQIGNNSHSNYMEILSSTGLVGALLYFAIYVIWWRRLLALRRVLRGEMFAGRLALLLSLSAAFLVIDLAFVTYYAKVTWIVFAGMIGEFALLERHARLLRRSGLTMGAG